MFCGEGWDGMGRDGNGEGTGRKERGWVVEGERGTGMGMGHTRIDAWDWSGEDGRDGEEEEGGEEGCWAHGGTKL